MADHKEAELENAARHFVSLLKSALATEAEPSSPNHEVQVQVQREQVAVGNTQPTQGQQQSALGNREQAGTRQHQGAQGQQRTPGCSRPAGNRVECNMASAFPGLFKSRKGCTPSPKRRAVRSTPIQFFLLNKCTERTPKSCEEMVLLQAGLGRKTISIPENADHSQISMILLDTYSKMVPLDGAWMLHKAAGGAGQRKLSVLAPEAEGYTGAYLSKVLGGKGCLYIMPIQDILDTSPLPYSSKEFEKMPKTRCATCHLSMPVQLLALHALACEPGSSDSIDFEQNLDPDVMSDFDESPAMSNPGNVNPCVLPCKTSSHKIDVKVACPLCSELFPEDYVEVHASTCGESSLQETRVDLDKEKYSNEVELKGRDTQSNSLAKAIHTLSGRVDTTAVFNMCVTREDMFNRGMVQWRRQKKSSPQNPLRVSFIGESGIDNGALRKEFLTEMMAGVEAKLFQGGSMGKTPKYSITDYDKENFKTVGEMIAVSITQGGPPPNFFKEWCYGYISTGEIDKETISKDDVTDPELRQLMEEVEMAEPDALINLLDRILPCGYNGPVTEERKEDIIKAIILHASVRLLPMLHQICSGMKLYGLCEMIVQQPHNFRELFVPGVLEKPDAEFLMGSMSPIFSDLGSLRLQREAKIVNFLQDFIQSIEDEEEKETTDLEYGHGADMEITDELERDEMEKPKITVSSFFQWLTGQAHVPFTSTERERFKIQIEFDHDCGVRYGTHTICFPVVNACSNSITFPTQHLGSYPEFVSIITQAFINSREFGRA